MRQTSGDEIVHREAFVAAGSRMRDCHIHGRLKIQRFAETYDRIHFTEGNWPNGRPRRTDHKLIIIKIMSIPRVSMDFNRISPLKLGQHSLFAILYRYISILETDESQISRSCGAPFTLKPTANSWTNFTRHLLRSCFLPPHIHWWSNNYI